MDVGRCPVCGAPLWALLSRSGWGCDECGFIIYYVGGGEKWQ